MNNQNQQQVVTGKVRLSYVHAFTPYINPNGAGEPKFSVTILVPKSDIATKQRIDTAINTAVQQGISDKWNGVRPPVLAIPVHDGDGVRPSDGMPFGEECKGHWVFTASSKQAPEVVDLGLNPIINQTEVYSGMYARVSVRFFPYASNGKKGIGCGLGNIQKVEDGEPLGGRTSAASDFGDDVPAGYAAPAPSYQPNYGTQAPAYQQPAAPAYQAPAMQGYQQPSAPVYQAPVMQGYQQQAPQIQYDPITGRPLNGGVMGI